MNILYAASEVSPFIKTGGLADTAGALPKALGELGAEMAVILPLHAGIDEQWRDQMKFEFQIYVHLAWRKQYCGLFSLEKDGVTYYFIDNQYYFTRKPIYGYVDDAERFAFFSRAVVELLPRLNWIPNIVHCNDWQMALIPIYMRQEQAEFYRDIKTIFTIHNIEYQGICAPNFVWDVLGLPQSLYDGGILRYEDGINLVKGALYRADYITTVSPTYAQELQDPYFACGLSKVIEDNSYKLRGIKRGIDTQRYDPETDKNIYHRFNLDNIAVKAKNKTKLQKELGLKSDSKVPIIGCVLRLVGHKGLDLIVNSLDSLMKENIQLVILGTGEWEYERRLTYAENRYQGKLSVNILYSETLASRIYAGSDMMLMPARMEPSGQTQMIAMRYGTVPIVRDTGGLRDVIKPYPDKSSNGFSFTYYSSDDMLQTIDRAVKLWKGDKDEWGEIRARCMKTDSSWNNPAKEYFDIYKQLCVKREPTGSKRTMPTNLKKS